MKRALLIAGGTVGGLGAVLSITPSQLSATGTTGLSGIASGVLSHARTVASITITQANTVAVSQTATPVVVTVAATPASSVPKATTKKTVTKVTTKKTVPKATTKKTAAPANKGVSGTFAGTRVDVSYGFVQVQVSIINGKINDVRALQAPSGRNDRFTRYAVPILREQTLVAQSSKIQGASGASYTSWGWCTSLQAALAKAGL